MGMIQDFLIERLVVGKEAGQRQRRQQRGPGRFAHLTRYDCNSISNSSNEEDCPITIEKDIQVIDCIDVVCNRLLELFRYFERYQYRVRHQYHQPTTTKSEKKEIRIAPPNIVVLSNNNQEDEEKKMKLVTETTDGATTGTAIFNKQQQQQQQQLLLKIGDKVLFTKYLHSDIVGKVISTIGTDINLSSSFYLIETDTTKLAMIAHVNNLTLIGSIEENENTILDNDTNQDGDSTQRIKMMMTKKRVSIKKSKKIKEPTIHKEIYVVAVKRFLKYPKPRPTQAAFLRCDESGPLLNGGYKQQAAFSRYLGLYIASQQKDEQVGDKTSQVLREKPSKPENWRLYSTHLFDPTQTEIHQSITTEIDEKQESSRDHSLSEIGFVSISNATTEQDKKDVVSASRLDSSPQIITSLTQLQQIGNDHSDDGENMTDSINGNFEKDGNGDGIVPVKIETKCEHDHIKINIIEDNNDGGGSCEFCDAYYNTSDDDDDLVF